MFELKPLSKEGIEAAQRKAVRYRLLNEAREAESICRDILRIDRHNQNALITLILALTDQFGRDSAPTVQDARSLLADLSGEYEKSYYSGIICERSAKSLILRGIPNSGSMAYNLLREAMEFFERAETVRPSGNEDALLRWNTCVRLIAKNEQIRPETEDDFRPLLE